MKEKNIILKKHYILIGIIVALVTTIPVLMPGLWKNGTGHDMFFHLLRIEGLSQGLASGQFPVKVQPGWYKGYGYAVSVFYGDLFLLPSALLHLAGLSLEISYKIFLFLCNLATYWIAFYSVFGITKKNYVAFLSATWYTFSLYRLIDVYIRHAVGEHTAMIFFPLVGVAMYYLLKEEPETKKGWILLTVAMTGVLQSHIISLEITVGILFVICLIFIKRVIKKSTLLAFVKAVLATIIANIWFLLPLFVYMKNGTFNANTNSEYKLNVDIRENGLLIKQLFGLFYHADGVNFPIEKGIENEMPLGVGLSGLVILVCALILLILKIVKKEKIESPKLYLIVLSGTLIALWMATYYFPWDFFENLHKVVHYAIVNIQFPWRFLGFATVFLCFTFAMIMAECKNVKLNYLIIALVFIITTCSSVYLLIDETRVSEKVSVKTLSDLNTCEPSGEEYLPYGADITKLVENEVNTTNAVVSNFEKSYLTMDFECINDSSENGYVLLPVFYYPGYVATAYNNQMTQKLSLEYGDNKRALVIVPAHFNGQVHVSFDWGQAFFG